MDQDDESLIPISALQHWIYCHRQAALIHLERAWADNRATAHGEIIHERAHHGQDETRGGQRLVRGLPLRSLKWGLQGQADVVAFTSPSGTSPAALPELIQQRLAGHAISLHGWKACPIEYKRGRPKLHGADRAQVAAQALCLEDMLGIAIPRAELYYDSIRRREIVIINEEIKQLVQEAVSGFRGVLISQRTPEPRNDKRCTNCSLKELCLPDAQPSAGKWFQQRVNRLLEDDI